MPIIQTAFHEPAIERIEKEEQVIPFLNEVRDSITEYLCVKNVNKSLSNKEVLKIVENGVYTGKRNSAEEFEQIINYKIDLSKANGIIKNYRENSEGGCKSCIYKGHLNPLPGEHQYYCGYSEDESSIDSETGYSPKITLFSERGCSDKEPVFDKTLEQIIEESEKI